MEILESLLDDLEGKLLLFALSAYVALLALPLMGCSTTEVAADEQVNDVRFRVVEVDNDAFWITTDIIVDTKTGCQYLWVKESEKAGPVLLADKYGNPLLADGYSRREVGMSDDGE